MRTLKAFLLWFTMLFTPAFALAPVATPALVLGSRYQIVGDGIIITLVPKDQLVPCQEVADEEPTLWDCGKEEFEVHAVQLSPQQNRKDRI